jgi:predicted O-methyltransferase YrrM
MNHINGPIPGWFTFPKFYSWIVERMPAGANLMEVGTYKGKSFAYLVVEAINANKGLNITGVDAFPWPDVRPAFDAYMKPVAGHYTIIAGNSIRVAKTLPDKSFDFIFIDADHTYDSCKNDILAYLLKVKPGGIIAGHDYCDDWPGVKKAVEEIFGNKFKTDPNEVVWYVEL